MTLACEKKQKWKSLSCVQLFAIHGLNSPGQNTRVGSLSLLQRIFPTQESNPSFPHCRQILYQLSHNGSPKILKWVAYPFSNGSSQPRNQTGVSCIAGGFLPTELSGNPQIYLHMQIICISSSPVSLQIQTRTWLGNKNHNRFISLLL